VQLDSNLLLPLHLWGNPAKGTKDGRRQGHYFHGITVPQFFFQDWKLVEIFNGLDDGDAQQKRLTNKTNTVKMFEGVESSKRKKEV
jgi:hypothetical protein